MDVAGLKDRKCKPCEGGAAPLTRIQAENLNRSLKDWILSDRELSKTFLFKDFVEALAFVNRVGAIAELESHHPDIFIHQYKKVKISLWTHTINGLSENDFIVAAKIDEELPC